MTDLRPRARRRCGLIVVAATALSAFAAATATPVADAATVAPGELAAAVCQTEQLAMWFPVSDNVVGSAFENKGECVAYVSQGGQFAFRSAGLLDEQILGYVVLQSTSVLGILVVNNTRCYAVRWQVSVFPDYEAAATALPGASVFLPVPHGSVNVEVVAERGGLLWGTIASGGWGDGAVLFPVC